MTKVLIAAAGTGGHLFPALYLAQALKEEEPNCEIRFVGVGRPLEAKIIDQAGFNRSTLRIQGVKGGGFGGLLRWLRDLPRPGLDCWKLFREFRPDIVVGVGGYVSVVPVIMARLLGIKSWIHEAEAQLGLANKLLIWFADRLSLSYPDTKVFFPKKARYTGHPLRPQLKQALFLTERKERFRLLIMGGSQGAAAIDKGMMELAPILWRLGVKEVLHQTRPENKGVVAGAYAASGFVVNDGEMSDSITSGVALEVNGRAQQGGAASVVSFLDRMEEAYAWADVIVARTGAGTTRELLVVNRPTICVPFPRGHEQLDNARILASKGIGIVVEEGEEHPALPADALQAKNDMPLKSDFPKRLKAALELALNPSLFSVPQPSGKSVDEAAAKVIAQGCLRLVSGGQ